MLIWDLVLDIFKMEVIMKKNVQIKMLLSVLILFFSIGELLNAQTNWVKDEGNPILEGEQGSWYQDITVVKVIWEDNIFKMWFCGVADAWNVETQIGYAESDDGLGWEVLEDPVIPVGATGTWNASKWPNTILRINDTLKMWYTASADHFWYNYSMGYAWSVEEHVWNVDTVPILEPGESGSWDEYGVYNPVVYFDGSMYHMWYNGITGGVGAYDPDQIGYATSQDGIHWEKDSLHNPVLTLQDLTFYSNWIQVGTVLFQNGEYQMWFEGFDAMMRRFGYATSTNGINWEVGNDSLPVLAPGPELWDNYELMFPSVLIHDGQYKMWYTGQCYGCDWKVGYATSDSSGVFIENYLTREFKYEVSPNPFFDNLFISYSLPQYSHVELHVYNLLGELVKTLFDGNLHAGEHRMEFDCASLPTGIYFCSLKTNLESPGQTIKIIKQ
jgi:predicted GH43/DUF377 family glycosyl hydrolase